MRNVIFILTFLFSLSTSSVTAQKKKTEPVKKVTESERILSTTFADALRNFYANDLTTAEKQFRDIIIKNNQHHPSYYMLSKVMMQRKNYSDAIYYLQSALKIDKKNEWYQEELATMYDATGNYKKSAELWLALSKSKSSKETYLFSLADAYLNLQKFTEVIKVYDKLEILIGYNEEITEVKKNIWLFLNNAKNAAKEYDRLIAEFPNEAKYYIKAGNILLTNELPNKAWNYYEKAQKINPNHPELQYALFDYYRKVGNNKEGYNVLVEIFKNPEFYQDEKASILKSLFSSYLRSNASTKISKNQIYEFTTIFTQVHPHIAEGWAHLATLQMLDKNYAEARLSLEKVLVDDVSKYNTWEDYFYILSQLKDYNAILDREKEVTELFPTNALLLYSIGVAYLNNENPQKSLELFQNALSFSYETALTAQIHYMMGNAYYELKEMEEAVKNWKLAKRKGLNATDLNEKLSKYE